jgi:hypothetical protein
MEVLSNEKNEEYSSSDNEKEVSHNDEDLKEDKDKLFCFCQKVYNENDGPMIQCDECKEWYHFSCVGLNLKSNIGEFICSSCNENTKIIEIDKNSEEDEKEKEEDIIKAHHKKKKKIKKNNNFKDYSEMKNMKKIPNEYKKQLKPKESFNVMLEYLLTCILLNGKKLDINEEEFEDIKCEISKVQEKILFRKKNIVESITWNEEFKKNLKTFTNLEYIHGYADVCKFNF